VQRKQHTILTRITATVIKHQKLRKITVLKADKQPQRTNIMAPTMTNITQVKTRVISKSITMMPNLLRNIMTKVMEEDTTLTKN